MSIGDIDIPVWVPVLMAVPIVLFLVFLVGLTRHARRNLKVMRDAGVDDPMTAGGQIAARVAQGRLLEGASTEDRIRELDDLLARGVISADEHANARRRALGG
ncbi:MAG: SHOCT domain-containing protein [Ilumatobacteraceae bacterium]